MSFFETVGILFDALLHSDEYSDTGKKGEQFTFLKLKKSFPKKMILRNLYLKKETGEYSEIDLVAVNKKGIFIFESKNFSGWIFGDENQTNWMQTLENGKKYKFFNPIMQNKTHIKCLKFNLQNFPQAPMFSVIVFSERCVIKKMLCTQPDTYVINREVLPQIIQEIDSQHPDMLTQEEVEKISAYLSDFSRPEEDVQQEHLKELEESFKHCPWCKSELYQRAIRFAKANNRG